MGSLLATVLLPDGSPAAGAVVTLVRTDVANEPPGAAVRSGTTGTGGTALLERVREGSYALTVTLEPSLAAYLPDVTVARDAQAAVTITLEPTATLEGAAYLSDRPAAGGVRVELLTTPLVTLAEAGGAYTLVGVPPGTFDVRFSAPGYAPVVVEGRPFESGATSVLPDVTLQRVAPYARFTFTVNGNEVSLDARGSYDEHGGIVRYRWDLGDGSKVEGGVDAATVRHVYSASGPKRIALTVTNEAGYSDTAAATVQITLPVLQVGGGPYTVRLPAGADGHFDVRVPGTARGAVVYVEVGGAPSIQVRQGAQEYYSVDPSRFRRLQPGQAAPTGAEEGASLDPLAISVARVCVGPCVLLPGSAGGATLTVHNPGATSRTVTVHLTAEPFADLNEPNEVCANAAPLGRGTDSGATELVGDTDWFELTASGHLTFDASPAIAMRAELFDVGCTNARTLQSGVPTTVAAGQLVRVRALSDEAGPAGASAYYLTLD